MAQQHTTYKTAGNRLVRILEDSAPYNPTYGSSQAVFYWHCDGCDLDGYKTEYSNNGVGNRAPKDVILRVTKKEGLAHADKCRL